MYQASKTDVRDVAGGAEDAFKVPDCFCSTILSDIVDMDSCVSCSRVWIDLVQKATTVLLVKDSCEAPRLILERLDVLNFDDEYVSWLGTFNFERPRQIMYLGKIDIPHILGRICISYLTTGPVHAFNLRHFAVLDLATKGNYLAVNHNPGM